METLKSTYEAKRAEYDALIAANNPAKMADIQRLNGELSALLQSMLEKLAEVRNNARNLLPYRDALLQKLVGIQNDASLMREQRDQYETLKMLQGHQEAAFNSSFFWYSLALGFVAVFFVIILMWKGGQRAPMIPTAINSPTTTAPFT
jgi:hypothetical protein